MVVAMVAGFVAFGNLRRVRPVGEPTPSTTAPGAADDVPVTIVIPARNEAASLPNLLGDLAHRRPAGARVVVVDDHSTDGTAELAARHDFVMVLRAPDLPRSWTGKTWACHTGAAAAPNGTLLFLDADVRVGPGALDAVVAEQRRRGGVVSVQPFHDVPTAVEQLSGLCNVVTVMGAAAGSRRPNAVFGPVICCDVADYRRVGGHAAVRTEVVEDVALGRRFRDAGLGVAVLGGGEALRFRMYPDGWRQLVEGWSKNLATGAAGTPLARALASGLFVCGLVHASLVALQTALALATGAPAPDGMAAATTVAIAAAATAVLLRRVGSFRWWAAAGFPVLTAFFVAVVVRSAWLTAVRRQVTWRGRGIPVHGDLAVVGAEAGAPGTDRS